MEQTHCAVHSSTLIREREAAPVCKNGFAVKYYRYENEKPEGAAISHGNFHISADHATPIHPEAGRSAI